WRANVCKFICQVRAGCRPASWIYTRARRVLLRIQLETGVRPPVAAGRGKHVPVALQQRILMVTAGRIPFVTSQVRLHRGSLQDFGSLLRAGRMYTCMLRLAHRRSTKEMTIATEQPNFPRRFVFHGNAVAACVIIRRSGKDNTY